MSKYYLNNAWFVNSSLFTTSNSRRPTQFFKILDAAGNSHTVIIMSKIL